MGDKGHGDGGVTELLHQLAADRLEEPDMKKDVTVCENDKLTAANNLYNKLKVSQSTVYKQIRKKIPRATTL